MAMWPGMFSVRRESLLGEAALFGVQEYLMMMMMAEPKRRNVSVFYWTGDLQLLLVQGCTVPTVHLIPS